MMITSLNDDKSAQLKNGYGGLGAGIGLAGGGSCEPPAQACRLSSPPSVQINVDSARRGLELKCSYGRAELMQQNSLFHQQHSNNQHLEEAITGTATTARAPTETAEAALNTSDRLDCVSTSSISSESDQITTNGQCHTKKAVSKHPHQKHQQHHYQQQHQHQHRQHQQQQKRTNLVNLVISLVATSAAGRQPQALLSLGAGSNCRPLPKLSPRPSSAVIISSSISILISIMLLLSSISESQCNSAPPGFLDAGKAISCEIGQPIIVSDYFPKDFIDEKRLSLCVTCTCQDGVIKCGQLAATPECALPSATKFNRGGGSNRAHSGTNAAGHSEQQTRPGAPFNKYKPANRAQPNGGHLHHHSQPAWVKPNNGKAKTISTSDVSQQQQQQQQPLRNKQVKSSAGGSGSSTPIAQPIGGPKQQQNRAPLGDHFKQLSSGPGSSSGRGFNQWSPAPLVRHQHHHNHHYRSHHDQVNEEEEGNAGGNDETSGRSADAKAARRHYRRPTVRPNWDELLASPSLPADDPKHLSNAASALGFETEEFLQLRNEKLQKLAGRTSTTAQTTTPSPTTMATTAIDEEETTSTDNGGGAGGEESDDLSQTTTTGDSNPTDSDRESDLMTTMPPINGFTTDNPEQEQSGQSTIKGGDVYEPNEPFNELTESPPFRQQEPSAIETTTTTTQQPPPPPPTSQPQPPFFNRGDSNAIDHSAANEIMEQVSQDGMLYIAIGVEAFILLSIFALMIVFYLYREKTTEDDDNQRHNNAEYRSVGQNHLQSPSRSPSIIEKA